MFNKILVPLDGSSLAERALEPAMAITRRQDGQVILLSVPVYKQVMVPGTAGYGLMLPDQSLALYRAEAEAYLSQIRQTHAEAGIDVKTVVIDGDVAGSIVDIAADEQVDLIVMTTHGYSGFTRWVLGSITERVLRSAPCPVLVIRHEEPLKHILITLDGSRLAEQALKPALAVARILGGRVTLLRVDYEEKLSTVEMGLLELTAAEICEEMTQDGDDRLAYYLDCVCRHVGSPGLTVETAIAVGQPAQRILDFAKENQVNLIAMATHGRTGLQRWVYGSVTEKVLRNADCAMLIVRPPKEETKDQT